MLGRVRNTKLGTNVSNEILLNSAKCQGYSFYRLWIIMGTLSPPPNTNTQIRVKLPNKNDFLKGFQPSNSKNIFQCRNFQSYFLQNIYRSMLISLESDRQIIPTLSGFISNHTNIYYQTMESYYQTMVDTLFSDFYCQNSAKSFTK